MGAKHDAKTRARLNDALYQYALAAGDNPPREVLNEFVKKYPEFHDEIVEFAVSLTMDFEGFGETDEFDRRYVRAALDQTLRNK